MWICRLSNISKENNNMEEDNKQKGTANHFSMGISLGLLVGVAIGNSLDNLAVGISVGMMLGVSYGLIMNRKNGNQEK